METIGSIKKGDTLTYFISWEGVALNELSSQVRTKSGIFLSDVVILETAAANTFQLTVLDTSDWPIGTVYTDIERIDIDDVIHSTNTFEIEVLPDVTQRREVPSS
jgi:hypothetical protein